MTGSIDEGGVREAGAESPPARGRPARARSPGACAPSSPSSPGSNAACRPPTSPRPARSPTRYTPHVILLEGSLAEARPQGPPRRVAVQPPRGHDRAPLRAVPLSRRRAASSQRPGAPRRSWPPSGWPGSGSASRHRELSGDAPHLTPREEQVPGSHRARRNERADRDRSRPVAEHDQATCEQRLSQTPCPQPHGGRPAGPVPRVDRMRRITHSGASDAPVRMTTPHVAGCERHRAGPRRLPDVAIVTLGTSSGSDVGRPPTS